MRFVEVGRVIVAAVDHFAGDGVVDLEEGAQPSIADPAVEFALRFFDERLDAVGFALRIEDIPFDGIVEEEFRAALVVEVVPGRLVITLEGELQPLVPRLGVDAEGDLLPDLRADVGVAEFPDIGGGDGRGI
ncbi:MAG: hypothetical protein EBZ67_13960, partial [Chitinophagia bacterium]|nr:hypothetical protein [Chitinophagia bacterium]